MGRRLTGLGIVIEGAVAAKPTPAMPLAYLTPDTTGIMAAEMLVLVGDPFGRVIGELLAEVQNVSWKLNDYGQARLILPQSDPMATEAVLRPGNRLLIQFNNGLPNWGGTLDLPRKWSDGRIELAAYGGERLLVDRMTAADAYFADETAGEIFALLLNDMAPIPAFGYGDIWIGGDPLTVDYHFRTVYDVFTSSLTGQVDSGDWSVTAELAGEYITFQANYYERRGVDHGRRLALVEGVNLAETGLEEQGTIINEWVVAGGGTAWDATQRPYAIARDEDSIALYGLRQRGEVRVDLNDEVTLAQKATAALVLSSRPRAIVSPLVLDRPPARWWQYDVGDRVQVELYEAGWDGYTVTARIHAREYLPTRGVCSLVME